MSPGAGAQGTKDGPLGVGPMPVLSEPLGSSISVYGSAGFAPCRPLQIWVFPQRALTDAALSTDLWWGARFGLASASFQHVILSEICTQLLCTQLLCTQLLCTQRAARQPARKKSTPQNQRTENQRTENQRTESRTDNQGTERLRDAEAPHAERPRKRIVTGRRRLASKSVDPTIFLRSFLTCWDSTQMNPSWQCS